jgi:hypothetical protein
MTSRSHAHHEQLIRSLAADLKPVRRLQPPGLRAAIWLAAVAALALSLAAVSERATVAARLTAAPDMWLTALGSSGAGCLRTWLVPGTHAAILGDTMDCLAFILALSVPLSVLLIGMLRRAYPLQPGLAAAVAGLASAAAAATLLNLFHPYDASATDVAVHVVAVSLVIIANRAYGGRILRRQILESADDRAA